jgi:hypothetical protein
MLGKLQFLFLPYERNNQKAKVLHLPSLIVLLFLIVIFQSSLSLVSRLKPGVLGFASNISIERLLELTNEQRREHGLVSLELNPSLNEAARQKATAMFISDCWSHNCNGKTPWWFFKNVGYQYLYAGENLARDFGESDSVVEAWMESPTHKDNILGSHYREIGFAVVDGILNGEETTLVVQLFGSREGTPAIASGEQKTAAQIMQVEGVAEELKLKTKPVLSSFALTKTFSLGLIAFLLIIFALDAVLIYQRRIVRISGKSFIHLSFFIIILVSILLSYQGQIL